MSKPPPGTRRYLWRLAAGWLPLWLLLVPARPALAQQLVDGSHDGDLAFIGFALTCFAFLGLLIVIDRLRPPADR